MSTPSAPAFALPIPQIAPVTPAERIGVIDILRGWALFGILLVNMTDDLPWDYLLSRQWTGSAERVAYHLIEVFAQEKFYTLFSFLFGFGFALQMGRAESRGASFVPLYSRRLLSLYLFGLVQILLVSSSQLSIYALLGFLLLLFRRRALRAVLIAAFACLLILPARQAVTTAIREQHRADPRAAQQMVREEADQATEDRNWEQQDFRIHSQGTFAEITAWHAPRIVRPHLSFPWVVSWGMLAMEFPLLLLGFYVGRRGFFENIPAHLPLIRKVMWWGLGLGLVGCSIGHIFRQFSNPAWPSLTRPLAELLWAIGAPALCFFYASGIVLLTQRERWKRRLAPLSAVGRLALSNYVFLWLVDMFLFYSYGLGLFGKFGRLTGLALVFVIFPLQVLWSRWWLRRFRFGPAEWLWRTLTYGQRQPMRASPAAA